MMHCDHCQLPVDGEGFRLDDSENSLRFCCPACRLVYQQIHSLGLDDYYRRRTAMPDRPEQGLPDYSGFDAQDYLSRHYRNNGEGDACTGRFLIDSLHCSACAWLVERRLQRLPGVTRASVNLQQRLLIIDWGQDATPISEILAVLFQLGYPAVEWTVEGSARRATDAKQYLQRRVGVAGLLMMQVGMLSLGLYAGEWQSMAASTRDLLRGASALLSLLAIAYCARPFLGSALNSLRNRSVNMDVPVSLALLLAWCGSLYATVMRLEVVYYDTVTMFIFFLLVSRFLEASSRTQLRFGAALLPSTVEKIAGEHDPDFPVAVKLPTAQLKVGDRVACNPGEVLAADGLVVTGSSGLDESLFSGESELQWRGTGDCVYAATTNVDQRLEIEVTAIGKDCAIARMESLAIEADADKPQYAQMIDRLSPWFVLAVLGFAMLTALYWASHDSQQLLMATIAVLVGACPCALSLATPTAFASANSRLRQLGIAPCSSSLLERLPAVSHVVFDKTGTLSADRMRLTAVKTAGLDRSQALLRAASLETYSSHPVAATLQFENSLPQLSVADANATQGKGVEGVIEGVRYRIGPFGWAKAVLPAAAAGSLLSQIDDSAIALVGSDASYAEFQLEETPRPCVTELLAKLREQGQAVSILSGDTQQRVKSLAAKLGIKDYQSGFSPAQKLRQIEVLQRQGEVVLMVGDGLNDIPVMAGADVSVAVANASALNKQYADAVLLNKNPAGLLQLQNTAIKTRSIVRQNMFWAIAYNSVAMPLAAMALLPPWIAALGMSLSSLVVVMNSRRLANYSPEKTMATATIQSRRFTGQVAGLQ